MADFEQYGEIFQTKLMHHLVTDKLFALQVLDCLEPEFFTDEKFVELCRIIIKHNEKYNVIPTFEDLRVISRTKYEDELEKRYLVELIGEIEKVISISDKKHIMDQAVTFCKHQAMINAVLSIVPMIKDDQTDGIFQILQKAMSVGMSKDNGQSLFEDVFDRTADKRNPVPMGFKMIDDLIAGGLSEGELGLILAGTGVGKSMMLAYMAASAVKQGKKVIYYTLELNDKMLAYRLEAALTGIPLTTLLMDVEGVHRKVVGSKLDEIKKNLPDGADIIVKRYPTKQASINTLKNHLATMEAQDFVPDIIFIDYADLMKPVSRYSDKRFELESNVEQIRGMAGEYNVPIWSASQSNRDGLDASIVGLKTISESLAKAMVADLVVSVGRTPELVEAGRACYYIAKSRLGPDKIVFTGPFDTTILNLGVDEEGLNETEVRQNDVNNSMRRAVRNVVGQIEDTPSSPSQSGIDDILRRIGNN